jgi:hypothetical protein
MRKGGPEMAILERVKSKVAQLLKNANMSAEERWLSQSRDLAELEHRLRELNNPKGWFPNHNRFNHIGGLT